MTSTLVFMFYFQLREYGCSLGFNLVADVFCMIPWSQVSSIYETRYDHAGQVKYEGCLYILLIQTFSENKHIEVSEETDLLFFFI